MRLNRLLSVSRSLLVWAFLSTLAIVLGGCPPSTPPTNQNVNDNVDDNTGNANGTTNDNDSDDPDGNTNGDDADNSNDNASSNTNSSDDPPGTGEPFSDSVSFLQGLEAMTLVHEDFLQQSEDLSKRLVALVAGSSSFALVNMDNRANLELLSTGSEHFGAIGIVDPSGGGNDLVVAFGPAGIETVAYDVNGGGFGEIEADTATGNPTVTDVSHYGSDPAASGVVIARFGGNRVESLSFDTEALDGSFGPGAINISNAVFVDANASGKVVSACALTADGPVVVVTQGVLNAQPGEMYVWHSDDPEELELLGNVGDDPRRVRCLNGLIVVTSFADSTLTTARLDPEIGMPLVVETIDVGGAPIGVDLAETSDGMIAALTTGFDNGTYTVTVISPDGHMESSTTADFGNLACAGPGFGVWGPDGEGFFTCHGSDTLVGVPALLP